MQSNRALLFVNGEPTKHYPNNLENYAFIAATDGAYHNYLCNSPIIPNYIIGDLDSFDHSGTLPSGTEIIHTPDQNKTDFEKAILFLASKGVKKFDIYGASGYASDHFLGNLSVVIRYYDRLNFTFYDNYCQFFFSKKQQTLCNIKNHIISFIPLSKVTNVTITGVKYPLSNATLTLRGLTSLRNKVITDSVKISFKNGELLVFIENKATQD
ncbi:thiamine diphosphokinase [Gilliamella sp. B3022]|uniref:thiamine diphosphokinase n=1 Tax=Gilliamella sp. B3022 TaxID=2817969 RepID=UPI002378F725|nr:thiamine diphosphokinase [Gilliamella sp. B3022]WDM18193.1 thiamine diphosphokinase [Gilliamella sp. B3022]